MEGANGSLKKREIDALKFAKEQGWVEERPVYKASLDEDKPHLFLTPLGLETLQNQFMKPSKPIPEALDRQVRNGHHPKKNLLFTPDGSAPDTALDNVDIAILKQLLRDSSASGYIAHQDLARNLGYDWGDPEAQLSFGRHMEKLMASAMITTFPNGIALSDIGILEAAILVNSQNNGPGRGGR